VRSGPAAPKVGEQIASDLRARIASGELTAGDRLATEEELLEEYGAARNTLREAFRILESEGLLELRRGRTGGVFIAHPGIEELARGFSVRLALDGTNLGDLYDAREAIELALVARLAQRRNAMALRHLEQAIDSAAEAAEIDDPTAFGLAAALLHETLIVEAGNQTLAVVARMMRDLVERSYSAMKPDQRSMRRAVRSYQRLYDFVKARDAEGAVEQLRKQMRFTRSAPSDLWTQPVKGP